MFQPLEPKCLTASKPWKRISVVLGTEKLFYRIRPFATIGSQTHCSFHALEARRGTRPSLSLMPDREMTFLLLRRKALTADFTTQFRLR
jgi:hypothetical protein